VPLTRGSPGRFSYCDVTVDDLFLLRRPLTLAEYGNWDPTVAFASTVPVVEPSVTASRLDSSYSTSPCPVMSRVPREGANRPERNRRILFRIRSGSPYVQSSSKRLPGRPSTSRKYLVPAATRAARTLKVDMERGGMRGAERKRRRQNARNICCTDRGNRLSQQAPYQATGMVTDAHVGIRGRPDNFSG